MIPNILNTVTDKTKSGFFLDSIVGEGTTVFELLASEAQKPLIRGNAFLVLNLRLHILDSVGRFHVKGDGLASG